MAIRTYLCGHSRTVHSRRDNSRFKIKCLCPACDHKKKRVEKTTPQIQGKVFRVPK